MVSRLKDPAERPRIRDSMLHDKSWDNEWLEIAGPEGITISSTTVPAMQPMLGKNVADIAKAQGKDPIDCIMDLLIADPAMEVVVAGMFEPDVALALKQPWTSIDNDSSGTSPEGILGRDHPHPRAYGHLPAHPQKIRPRGPIAHPAGRYPQILSPSCTTPRTYRPRCSQSRYVGQTS